jgi:hypothetical protein
LRDEKVRGVVTDTYQTGLRRLLGPAKARQQSSWSRRILVVGADAARSIDGLRT